VGVGVWRVQGVALTLQRHAERLERREREGRGVRRTKQDDLHAHEQAGRPNDAKYEKVERGEARHAARVGTAPHQRVDALHSRWGRLNAPGRWVAEPQAACVTVI
jgi:hypothetical protein